IAVVAAMVSLIPAAQAHAADPVIAAAGDIACEGLAVDPDFCQQQATSDLMLGQPLAAVLPLGDEQYLNGELGNFQQFYDPSWGRFRPITHPVAGNHEHQTRDATGYFQYFGAAAGAPNTGYYSYNVGRRHSGAVNSNCANLAS